MRTCRHTGKTKKMARRTLVKFLRGRWNCHETAEDIADQIEGGEPYATEDHRYEVEEEEC